MAENQTNPADINRFRSHTGKGNGDKIDFNPTFLKSNLKKILKILSQSIK